MSKNFELLLQAGAVGHYFHDIDANPPDKQSSSAEKRYRVARNEQLDHLVRRVFLNGHRPSVRSLMISSASGADQPTEACAQIGKTLASLVDTNVCIVDANIARPSVHRLFGNDNLVGLADAVVQSKPAKSLTQRIEDTNLYYLAAGKVPATSRTQELDFTGPLDELQREFEYLVVAAPPAGGGRSLTTIGHACDGALLVLEPGGVPLNVMLRIRREFDAAAIPLFGVILSGSTNHRHASSILSYIG